MKNNYYYKWILQRISALFLIPLTFWFIYHCLSFQNLRYVEFKLFFQSYLNSFLFIVMMIAMLIHAKLGCETIVQDYIASPSKKKILKHMINLITFLSLFSVIFAIFKMSVL